MEKRRVPQYFKHIIAEYYANAANQQSEDNIMKDLPSTIRLRMSLLLNKDILQLFPILSTSLMPRTIIGLMQKLTSQTFAVGEYIVTAGELGNALFFLKRGEVEVLLDNNITVLAVLRVGEIFGEQSVLSNTAPVISARAVLYCDVLRLEKEDFEQIASMSHNFRALTEKIRDRRQKLVKAAVKNMVRSDKISRMQNAAKKSDEAEGEKRRRKSVVTIVSNTVHRAGTGKAPGKIATKVRQMSMARKEAQAISAKDLFKSGGGGVDSFKSSGGGSFRKYKPSNKVAGEGGQKDG